MGLALRLALKQKFGATPKWPLGLLKVALLTADSYHIVKTCEKGKTDLIVTVTVCTIYVGFISPNR